MEKLKYIAGFTAAVLGSPYSAAREIFKDGNWHPIWPTKERLVPERPGGWFHYSKNVLSECIAADPQWWGKIGAAVLVLALIF